MLPRLCICTAEVKDEDIHTLAAWPNLFFGQRREFVCLRVCVSVISLVLKGFSPFLEALVVALRTPGLPKKWINESMFVFKCALIAFITVVVRK